MYIRKSVCLKCGRVFESERIYEGCSYCRAETFVSSITPVYELPKTDGKKATPLKVFPGNSMETYRELLPSKGNQPLVDFGMGDTAFMKLPVIGKELGLDLYIKDETRNPTWGYKDRLNAVLINKATELGVPDAAYASTGNNGVSGAAFAAKAGIPCVTLIIKGVNKTLEIFMQVYGAKLIGVKTVSERWEALKYLVNQCGWRLATNYVVPIVGSNPWAIEGYKPIAYELYKQMDELPDKIVVPICYGDTLFGIMKGFSELKEIGFINHIPQVVSVEGYGPVAKAYNSECEMIEPVEAWDSVASSIFIKWGTYHPLYALRRSRRLATALEKNEDSYQVQSELVQKKGIYCESASAASYVGLKELVIGGKIRKGEKVVLLVMTSGVKDTKATSSYLPEFPESIAGLDGVLDILEKQYQMKIR